MDSKEKAHLLISTVVMGVAFAVWLAGGIEGISEPRELIQLIAICLFTISLGFALHELGHRVVARRHGLIARFQMWVPGLILALGFALFSSGFIFLAPGAVVISESPYSDRYVPLKKQMGHVALAGPLMNVILALVFFGVYFYLREFSAADLSSPVMLFILRLCFIGAYLNSFIGMFNMIPIPPFDGNKILKWNKIIWVGFTGLTVAIYFLCKP
jgi:Zn-dependent protease